MTESKRAILAYPRLCIAYFCQFAIWAAWAGALSAYVQGVLKFSGEEAGWLYTAIPFGAIIAPLFIGPIADRFFSTQKVVSVLHFIGGLALLACGWLCMSEQQGSPLVSFPLFPLIMGLMLLSGICYMPTMGLMNSVVFKHLPKASMAPFVFVFGTFGWICSTLAIACFCGAEKEPYFFFVGGGVSVFLALYALTLPHTPPKGAPAPGEKKSSLGALSLFMSFSFIVFVFCVFVASIPACGYYFPAQVPFLSERGYPSPLALTTLNQFSELFFMLALAFCIPRFGLKNVILMGMAAWAIRYFCFAEPYFEATIVGLLLHGLCYSFLYVAAYMYAEKVAPENLKASAQSIMVFLLLGVGQVLGSVGYGKMTVAFPPTFTGMPVKVNQLILAGGQKLPDGVSATDSVNVPIPSWSEGEGSWTQYLDLTAQVNKLLGKKEVESQARSVDLGKLLGGQPLTPETIKEMDTEKLVQDGVKISKTTACCDTGASTFEPFVANVQYNHADLKALGKTIAEIPCALCGHVEVKEDFSLTRANWLAAQAHDWKKIWQLPAICIVACFVIFLLLGREPKDPKGA